MPDQRALVIVESPAKARTIARFLGPKYIVESSIGHIRDLPRRASDVPAAYKKEPWARLGVDVDHGFRPLYILDPEKKQHIKKLKELLQDADTLFLATDEDREGESIAWHLLEVLKPKIPVKRMVFHEITERAIQDAISKPREVDRRLVDAQEARRILDRLYGYEVSPVLWKKVMPRLSAGRVQSVATRIIVERERERMRFVPASYWDVEAEFLSDGGTPPSFAAQLVELEGQRLATGKDFAEDGKLIKRDCIALDESRARELATALQESRFEVQSVERKPSRRSPSPPFMTSTLQQEAGRKLRFAAARTMRAAQRLYESGYITYMRTDSTTLAESAIASARQAIEQLYGAGYLPERPRTYSKKVKNAQEAHEAIRPAGDAFRSPEAVAREVGHDEARLYELIWMRTIASQMKDAQLETVSVRIGGRAGERPVVFAVRGNTIIFPGFLRAYVEGSDDPSAELEQREKHLPMLTKGQSLDGQSFAPRGHETQAPPRFTEASLVRRLEELGVGRPSTYASIISTILDRGYVWKKGTALVPSFTAFAVVQLLTKHFGDLVDYAFTARMEDDLDAIAGGTEQPEPWLSRFYFGKPAAPSDGHGGSEASIERGLKTLVADRLGEIDARAINSLPLGQDDDGREVVVRVGRHGAYLQRGEDTTSIPDDQEPDQLDLPHALKLLAEPSGDRELGRDPETGLAVYARQGRFGPFVQLGEGGGKEKPRTSSLLRNQSIESISLDDALALLRLPRVVGTNPEDGEPITALLGRYGPYVSKGKDSRSLESEDQVFTVTLEEALALFAKPRTRGRRAAAEPLRELGADPVSGNAITLREGRFGYYVTDGETNASLRKGDDPASLENARAVELLQLRRERGPVAKKRPKKSGSGASKKSTSTATKRTSATKSKKTTTKAPAKSTAASAAPATGAKSSTAKPVKKASAKKKAKSTASPGSKRAATKGDSKARSHDDASVASKPEDEAVGVVAD